MKICIKIYKLIFSLPLRFYYFRSRRKFSYLSKSAVIQKLLRLDSPENIEIGERVIIQKMTWLAAVPLTNATYCKLIIGNGTIIGNFNHIYATNEIIIGKNVLTADKVYIADNGHGYEDVSKPILLQPIKQFASVYIGDGTWIGENVCIIGAKIGKNCVIGANSVVTKDIPDYCVAVGAPAKVIKRYDFETSSWICV